MHENPAPVQYLTQEQVRHLISAIDDVRDRLIVRVLYETGCTPGELVSIKAGDVSGNKIRLDRPDSREAAISGRLARDISLFVKGNRISPESYLLSTRQSKKISEKRVRQIIQDHTSRFSFEKINPVMFRYYHIAHAYENGIFIEDIARQLGLSSLRVFQVISGLGIRPRSSSYNSFLSRVG